MRLLVLVLLLPAFSSGGVPSVALQSPRAAHTATLLRSGEVLVVGGCAVDSCELDARGATSELFDPRTSRFRAGPRLAAPRDGHAAALLPGGDVLVVGGWAPELTRTAERFDGSRFAKHRFAGTLRAVGRRRPRSETAGCSWSAGRRPAAGRSRARSSTTPAPGRFSPTGSMRSPRGAHVAVRLLDGRVLVIGGSNRGRVLATTELYDPKLRAVHAPARDSASRATSTRPSYSAAAGCSCSAVRTRATSPAASRPRSSWTSSAPARCVFRR